MSRMVVFGAGAIGGAFCVPLTDQGHQVQLVGSHQDEDAIEQLATTGRHDRLGIALPAAVKPSFYTELPEVLRDWADLVIVAVSARGLPWAMQQLAAALERPVPVLLLTRGLIARDGEIDTLPALASAALRAHGIDAPVGVIAGPLLAPELAARRNTSVLVAWPEPVVCRRLAGLLRAPYLQARPSRDVIGAAAATTLAAMLALGVAAGSGRLDLAGPAENGAAMQTSIATLSVQAQAELAAIVRALGGQAQTAFGPAGAGCLQLAHCGGPDARLGRLLGRGIGYWAARTAHLPGETSVGAELALAIGPTLAGWCATGRLRPEAVPLARALIDALCHKQPLVLPWTRFGGGRELF